MSLKSDQLELGFSIYIMDHPKFIASNQWEEPISIQRVKV